MTPCGFIRDCRFPSSAAAMITGEQRKRFRGGLKTRRREPAPSPLIFRIMRVARGCWQDYCEEAQRRDANPQGSKKSRITGTIRGLAIWTHSPECKNLGWLRPPLGPLQSGVRTTSGLGAQPALGPFLWAVLTLLFVRTPAKKPSPGRAVAATLGPPAHPGGFCLPSKSA
jgi:hypothetical protein